MPSFDGGDDFVWVLGPVERAWFFVGLAQEAVYPYLLRGMTVERPNQVWAMDITYIPMARGFVYLTAVVDWFSRRVLAWRVSISMEVDFCLDALDEALARHGLPCPVRRAGRTFASDRIG